MATNKSHSNHLFLRIDMGHWHLSKPRIFHGISCRITPSVIAGVLHPLFPPHPRWSRTEAAGVEPQLLQTKGTEMPNGTLDVGKSFWLGSLNPVMIHLIHFGVNGFSDLPVSSETAAIFSYEWVKYQDFLGCTSAG